MSEYQRPLPNLADELTAPFWQGTREHRVLVQRCEKCSYLRWPPGPICPECQHEGAIWSEVLPTGTLWSTAEYHRAFSPAFADDLPYTVGLIQLNDGPRMYGTLRGEVGSFQLGQRVRAVFFDATPEVTLLQWEMI
ncbi:Zn-ribbon domain-containing OB-fold protein [Subtercola sp. YIM 133946]|uniref:Zn-ribbon domain-containing OB-fold protein n=1 Tax=Subtercola sp. YIM 133946 TaxID=3118909 RepID=UPI002F9268E2